MLSHSQNFFLINSVFQLTNTNCLSLCRLNYSTIATNTNRFKFISFSFFSFNQFQKIIQKKL